MTIGERLLVSGIGLLLALGPPAGAQTPPAVRDTVGAERKENVLTTRATGTFEVELTPQGADEAADGTPLGRMSIDKRFHGDLVGTSRGEMLTAVTGVAGSAGYVALERVSGTLHGRSGTFVLQHSGSMERGAQRLVITVVPDSGTEELTGLAGTMTIRIEDGGHFYELEYALAGPP